MEAAKERFAGANALALTAEAFELDYPRQASDVERYTSFIPNKNKKTKYVLAIRLFSRTHSGRGEISSNFENI